MTPEDNISNTEKPEIPKYELEALIEEKILGPNINNEIIIADKNTWEKMRNDLKGKENTTIGTMISREEFNIIDKAIEEGLPAEIKPKKEKTKKEKIQEALLRLKNEGFIKKGKKVWTLLLTVTEFETLKDNGEVFVKSTEKMLQPSELESQIIRKIYSEMPSHIGGAGETKGVREYKKRKAIERYKRAGII